MSSLPLPHFVVRGSSSCILAKSDRSDARIPPRLTHARLVDIGCSSEARTREKHPPRSLHSVSDSQTSKPDCNGALSPVSVNVRDQLPSTSGVSIANSERLAQGDSSDTTVSGEQESSSRIAILKSDVLGKTADTGTLTEKPGESGDPSRSVSTRRSSSLESPQRIVELKIGDLEKPSDCGDSFRSVSTRRSSRRNLQRRIQARLIRQARKSRSRLPARVTSADGDGLVVEGYSIGKEGVVERLFWLWGRWLYESWFAQETRGTENLPLDRGMFFMACNHSSHLDCGATFVGAWTGGAKRVYALGARDYFFSNPLLAWFVTTCMHVIPINRRKFSQQELDTLLQLKAASGPHRPTAVLIFPEGTRSLTGSLQPFKSGVGLLAEQLDVPVVPVCVQGTFEALPKGRTIPLRRRVTVEFGRPLDVQEYLQVAQVVPPDAAVVSPPASTQGDAVQSTSAPGPSASEDTERAMRRAAHRRFADALQSSVADMAARSKGRGAQGETGTRSKGRNTQGEAATESKRQLEGQGKWATEGARERRWVVLITCTAAAAVAAASFGGVSPEGISQASYAAAASLLARVPNQPGETAGLVAALVLCCALLIVGFRPIADWAGPYLFFPLDDQEEMQ